MSSKEDYYQYDENWPLSRKKGEKLKFEASDDLLIIKYLLKTKDVVFLGGQEVWKKMEKSKRFNPRGFTYQSLKERWRKTIAKSITRYGLRDEQMELLLCKPKGYFKSKQRSRSPKVSLLDQLDESTDSFDTPDEEPSQKTPSEASPKATSTPGPSKKVKRKLFNKDDVSSLADSIVSEDLPSPSRVLRIQTSAVKKNGKTAKPRTSKKAIEPRRSRSRSRSPSLNLQRCSTSPRKSESPFESSSDSDDQIPASPSKSNISNRGRNPFKRPSSQKLLRNAVRDTQETPNTSNSKSPTKKNILKKVVRPSISSSDDDNVDQVMGGALAPSENSTKNTASFTPSKKVSFSESVQEKSISPRPSTSKADEEAPKETSEDSIGEINEENFVIKDLTVVLKRLPVNFDKMEIASLELEMSPSESVTKKQNKTKSKSKSKNRRDSHSGSESELEDSKQDEDFSIDDHEISSDEEEDDAHLFVRKSPRTAVSEAATSSKRSRTSQRLNQENSNEKSLQKSYCEESTDSSDVEQATPVPSRKRSIPQNSSSESIVPKKICKPSTPLDFPQSILDDLDDSSVTSDVIVHAESDSVKIRALFTVQRSLELPGVNESTPAVLGEFLERVKATFKQHGIWGPHGECPGLGEFLFMCHLLHRDLSNIKKNCSSWQGRAVDRHLSAVLEFGVCSNTSLLRPRNTVDGIYKSILSDSAWMKFIEGLSNIYKSVSLKNCATDRLST